MNVEMSVSFSFVRVLTLEVLTVEFIRTVPQYTQHITVRTLFIIIFTSGLYIETLIAC
jgi:hypothetical protein